VGHRSSPYDPTLSRQHHYCWQPTRESVRREAASFKQAWQTLKTVRVVDIALGNGEHKQSVTQGSRRAVTILSTLGIKDLDPVPRKTQQHMA